MIMFGLRSSRRTAAQFVASASASTCPSSSLFLSAGHLMRRRGIASVTNTDTLPLAGYKVLDLTRVLAGV